MSMNELTGKLSPKHMKELGTEMLRKDFEIIYIEKQIQDLIGNCRFYSSHEYYLSSSKILTEMVFGCRVQDLSDELWCLIEEAVFHVAYDFIDHSSELDRMFRKSRSLAHLIVECSQKDNAEEAIKCFINGFNDYFAHVDVSYVETLSIKYLREGIEDEKIFKRNPADISGCLRGNLH